MSWMDEELDGLFKEQSSNQTFTYSDSYWTDFEANVLDKKKDSGLWYFAASSFLVCFILVLGLQGSFDSNEALLAHGSKSVKSQNRDFSPNNVTNSNKAELLDEVTIMNPNESNLFGQYGSSSENQNGLRKKAQNDIFTSVHFSSNEQSNKQLEDLNDRMNGEVKVVNNNLIGDNTASSNENNIETEDLKQLAIKPIEDVQLKYQLLTKKFPDYRRPKAVRFYLQAFGGLGQSMVSDNSILSNHYGAGLGLIYTRGNLFTTIGVNGRVSNHNELQVTRSSKLYGFGSTEYIADIDYANLYNADLTASLGYKFGSIKVFGGVDLSYLLTTKSFNRLSQTVTSNEITTVPLTERETVYGYMESLNRITIKPFIGISKEFNTGIDLGLNLGMQTINAFDSKSISGLNKNVLNGQLFIRKNF